MINANSKVDNSMAARRAARQLKAA